MKSTVLCKCYELYNALHVIMVRGNVLWVCNPSCGVITSFVAQLWHFQESRYAQRFNLFNIKDV